MLDEQAILRELIEHRLVAGSECLQFCSGGDTHQSFRTIINESTPPLFIKANTALHADVLASEFASLTHMQTLFPEGYPKPIYLSTSSETPFLVMEYLDLSPLQANQFAQLGELLARQHAITQLQHGWPESNHIGPTPQSNIRSKCWADFFWEQRLVPQLNLADQRGLDRHSQTNILSLEALIRDVLLQVERPPSLLHGDLWGGNVAFDEARNKASLFDPAPYYGDPEADLAMTQLFGGFGPEFYAAYYESRGPGQKSEHLYPIYNLYHALNHFNAFGANYSAFVSQQTKKIEQMRR